MERLASEALAAGDATAAARALRRATVADPLRESAHRALMEALAAGGEYTAASEVYRELRLLLHREMNARPSPETTTLFDSIRAEARRRAAGPMPGNPAAEFRSRIGPRAGHGCIPAGELAIASCRTRATRDAPSVERFALAGRFSGGKDGGCLSAPEE